MKPPIFALQDLHARCVMRFAAMIIAALPCFASSSFAQTATLKIRFVMDGDFSDSEQDAVDGGTMDEESLMVNPRSKGIADIVVFLSEKSSSLIHDSRPYQAQTIQLKLAHKKFDRRVVIARVGDTLELLDRGPGAHNPNIHFLTHLAEISLFVPGGMASIKLDRREIGPVLIDDAVYRTMKSHLFVLEHSFIAVSNINGELEIKDLPANEEVTFSSFHERIELKEVEVGGRKTTWTKGKFDVQLKPGLNDFGVVVIGKNARSRKP